MGIPIAIGIGAGAAAAGAAGAGVACQQSGACDAISDEFISRTGQLAKSAQGAWNVIQATALLGSTSFFRENIDTGALANRLVGAQSLGASRPTKSSKPDATEEPESIRGPVSGVDPTVDAQDDGGQEMEVRVLIGDDDPGLQRSLRMIKQRNRFGDNTKVLLATTPAEVQSLAQAESPLSCVISDYDYSPGNGLSVLSNLQQQGLVQGRMALFTGSSAIEARLRSGASALGADFFSKPAEFSEIQTWIQDPANCPPVPVNPAP